VHLAKVKLPLVLTMQEKLTRQVAGFSVAAVSSFIGAFQKVKHRIISAVQSLSTRFTNSATGKKSSNPVLCGATFDAGIRWAALILSWTKQKVRSYE